MKILTLKHATERNDKNEPIDVSIIFGPGISFRNMKSVNATAVTIIGGVVLVLETEAEITRLLKEES